MRSKKESLETNKTRFITNWSGEIRNRKERGNPWNVIQSAKESDVI
jgi:hypothetical protein